MKTIGIIGSAGRRDDRPRMNRHVYNKMVGITRKHIIDFDIRRGVSGGAAWADHVAVDLFLQGDLPELHLYLPAHFHNSRFIGGYGTPGSITNYYHDLMNTKLARSSLREIQRAIDKGATYTVIPGFKQRNQGIAEDAELLLAFTFGKHSGFYNPREPGWNTALLAGLKPGGTSHTWNHSHAQLKIHQSLSTN